MKNTNSNNSLRFRLTSEEKFVLLIILTVIIGLMIRCYGNQLVKETRKQVIESAVLVETNEVGYAPLLQWRGAFLHLRLNPETERN